MHSTGLLTTKWRGEPWLGLVNYSSVTGLSTKVQNSWVCAIPYICHVVSGFKEAPDDSCAAIQYRCLWSFRFKKTFALLMRFFDIIMFLHGIQTQQHEKITSPASLKKTSHSNWRRTNLNTQTLTGGWMACSLLVHFLCTLPSFSL